MKEHEAASAWREKLKLDKRELAQLSGYSYEAICLFERGIASKKTKRNGYLKPQGPIDPIVWKRYKLACSAVERQLRSKKEFEW